MTNFPSIDAIETMWKKSPGGLCILVEGETDLDDPWFYNQWFGNEAKRFTFYPQDGWKQVEYAVKTLRNILGCKKVYGVVDRDFCHENLICRIDPSGLVRTRKYTLENYLLDPVAWSQYMGRMRNPERRFGWETVEEARATIESFYRECIPVSVFNSLVVEIMRSHEITPPTFTDYLRFFDHPLTAAEIEASAGFIDIQSSGILPNFQAEFFTRVQNIQSMGMEQLETIVSGKLVLKIVAKNQSRFVTRGGWSDLLGEIAYLCKAPEEIQQALEVIWADSQS